MDITSLHNTILEHIHGAQHVMLVMHRRPDGDTAGSALGMSHYLDSIQKPHTVFCVDELTPTLHHLPGRQKMTSAEHHWHPERVQFDLVIVFDSSTLSHTGADELVAALTHEHVLINIDHHATNKHYGHVNLVLPEASSTCEIVHDLLAHADGLTKDGSTCLMTGLITDTGNFTNLATTASAIQTASRLLLKGVNMKQITNTTMNNRNVTTLKLWGRALERLTTTAEGLVYTVITQSDILECNADQEAIEGVANFLNSIDQEEEAKAVMVLTETSKGEVKGSLRTTNPLIDVSKLATLLGGGGHKKAAGFSFPGRLVQQNGQWRVEQPA